MKVHTQLLILLNIIINFSTVFCEDSVENRLSGVLKNTNTLSQSCLNDLKVLLEILKSDEEDDAWALKMIEATSSIAMDKSSYDYGDMGHFEECIHLQSSKHRLKGKYCISDIAYKYTNFTSGKALVPPQELAIRIAGGMHLLRFPTRAICIPSTCSDEDAGYIMTELQHPNVTLKNILCQTIDEVYQPLDTNAYLGISIMAAIASIIILATLYDIYYQKYKKATGQKVFVSLSVYTNGKKLLQMQRHRESPLDCLDGIRVLSMIWIILFHTYVKYISIPVFNSKESMQITGGIFGTFFTTGQLACDAFFLVGGTLVTYVYFSKQKDGNLSFYNIMKHYIHRYIRLTPAMLGVIIITATLLKYMGSGPKWEIQNSLFQEACQKYWWSTILYIHNELNLDGMCLAHTWYLSVDTQLYILSPLIFYMLKKYTNLGVTALTLLILSSIILAFFKSYFGNVSEMITTTYYQNALGNFFISYVYMSTEARAAPWLMGTILGYMLTKPRFTNKQISKVTLYPTWILSLTVLALCTLGNHPSLRSEKYSDLENALFAAIIRPIFALSIGWVIWGCATNQGGIINRILSWPVFHFYNKFIYSTYLIHPYIIDFVAYSKKSVTYFNTFNMIYWFCGAIVLIFPVSILWVLVFEIPPVNLERLAFAKIESKRVSTDCQVKQEVQVHTK